MSSSRVRHACVPDPRRQCDERFLPTRRVLSHVLDGACVRLRRRKESCRYGLQTMNKRAREDAVDAESARDEGKHQSANINASRFLGPMT